MRYARAVVTGVVVGILGLADGCATEPAPVMGSMSLELDIAPGVRIDTVSWTIGNALTGYSRTGTVVVRFSDMLAFQVGGIPAGSGYAIALSAMSVGGGFHCAGSAEFEVAAQTATPVNVVLYCSAAPPEDGTVVVTGTTQICANLGALEASPLETAVGTPIALSATGSAGPLPVSYRWTAPAGTFDDPESEKPTFTCPATAGPVTISVTVAPGAPSCNTVTTGSVTVTCSAATFTGVYTAIIGQRCTGCHRPGGSGVTVGMLDMSTPAAAYANLVGVNAQGTGAGASGVTCASAQRVRVVPGDPDGSLLYHKVHSKLAGTPAPCGSPMPLPATAAPLTQAEVGLISGWITGGAPDD
jgi:hypothetical protein